MSLPGRRLWIGLAVAAALTVGCSSGYTSSSTTVPGRDLVASDDLLVVGDWGAGSDAQSVVAATMESVAADLEPAAILTTGDNLYSDDWQALLAPYRWATDDGIPFLVAWGNHDVETGQRIEVVDAAFDDPPRWARHEWGDIDLVILDSNQVRSDDQIDFLEATLEGSDDPTIVVFHHPAYSCGSHGGTRTVVDEWVSRFDDDVFLVLNGHEHNYQRFVADDVTYVVTGGGGAALTELARCSDDHPSRIAGEATHGFVTLEHGDGVTGTVYDADGNVVDVFELALP